MFFYGRMYTLPTPCRLGSINEDPLSPFDSQEWIVLKQCTIESYRLKLSTNIRNSLKTTLGSQHVHLKWTMPIDVFRDLFSTKMSLSRTKVSFVSHTIQMDRLNDFLSPKWDHK